MRENPRDQSPSNQHSLSELSSLLASHSITSVEVYAERQLHQMEALGAKFAERLPKPIVIHNPLGKPTREAILITRWIGHGVFGVLFPLSNGEVAQGWIPMRSAMKRNPGLTPSGTISAERWDKDIFSRRDHVMPSSAAIAKAAQSLAQIVAADLLQAFPNRIDLTASLEQSPSEVRLIQQINQKSLRPFSKELRDGLHLFGENYDDDAQLHRWMASVIDTNFQQMVTIRALRIFRETRIHGALAQYEQRQGRGLIHELVTDASDVTASLIQGDVRSTLRRNPFATDVDMELSRNAGIGLAMSLARRSEFAELWRHLSDTERARILTHISLVSWQTAARAYSLCN